MVAILTRTAGIGASVWSERPIQFNPAWDASVSSIQEYLLLRQCRAAFILGDELFFRKFFLLLSARRSRRSRTGYRPPCSAQTPHVIQEEPNHPMQIRRVEVKDFKSHKHFVCEFKRGTNAICGPNGAGKTSLIEAIGFALFNASPSKKMIEMIRRGGRKLEIYVDFQASADERLYRAVRTLTPSSASVYRVIDLELNEAVAADQKECLKKLSNLMDLHPNTDLRKLYTEILGVPQGTMTSAFLAGDKERRDIFGPLLRVDEYDTAYKEMQPRLLREMEHQKSRLEAQIESNAKRLLQLPAATQELHERQSLVATNEKACAELEQELSHLQQGLQTLEAKEKVIAALEVGRQSAHNRWIRCEAEQEQAQKNANEAREAREIIQPHLQPATRHAEAKKEEARLVEQAKLYQKTREIRQDKRHRLDSAEREEKRLQEKRLEQIDAQQRLIELEPLLADYQTARSEQKRLEQEVTALKALNKQIKELDQEIAQCLANIEACRTSLQHWPFVEQQIEQLHSLRKQEPSALHLVAQKKLEQQEHLRRKNEIEQIRIETTKIVQEGQSAASQLKQAEEEREPCAERLEHWQRETSRLMAEITQLEVRIEDETDFRADVSGGICPFFSKRCKNLPEGQDLRDFLTKNLERYRQELADRQSQYAKAQQEEKAAQQAHNDQIARCTALSQRKKDLEQQYRERRNKSSACEKEMLDHPDVTGELSEAEAEVLRIQTELSSLEGIEATHKQLQGIHAQLSSNESNLNLKRYYLDTKHTESIEKAGVDSLLHEIQQRIEAMGDPEAEARRWQHIAQERTKTEKELQSWEAKATQLRGECASLDEEMTQLGDPETTLEHLRKELRETQNSYEILLQHKANAESVEKYEALFEKKRLDWQQASQHLAKLDADLCEARKDLDPEQLQAQRKAHGDCNGLFQHARGALGPARKLLETSQRLVAELVELEARQQEIQNEYTRLIEALECFHVLRKTIREAGPKMTSALIQSISGQANRIFREITQRHDWDIQWNEDFLAELKEGEHSRSFANLSGGEQMAVALAIRLALIRELSDIRLAFFDEPTAHMDQERRRGLAQMIRSVSDFDQLFVISHDDTFESMTDHYVLVGEESRGL